MRLFNIRFAGFITAIAALGLLASCHAGENNPGRAYASDMYYSRAVEIYYPSELTENGMSAILPPENTVAYGHTMSEEADESMLPFTYPFTPEGYLASAELRNPLTMTEEAMMDGKRNYLIYCGICHGAEGNGKGPIVTNGKYNGAPPSFLEDLYLDLSEGQMFYSVHYGKAAMGSYAYAMSKEQRWEVIAYVKQLQHDYKIAEGMEVVEAADVAHAGQTDEAPVGEHSEAEQLHEEPAAAH